MHIINSNSDWNFAFKRLSQLTFSRLTYHLRLRLKFLLALVAVLGAASVRELFD